MARLSSGTRGSAGASEGGGVRFSLLNWAFLAAGMVAIIAGFALLARGSTVAAPLLLMLGFLVLIPIGIIR